MKKIKIALLGLGTVGTGVVKGLARHGVKMQNDLGFQIELSYLLVRNRNKKRNVDIPRDLITTTFDTILEDPEISVVIEAMGGMEPAYTYCKQALQKGCHLITANKALIARHGIELHKLAAAKGVQLLYEASVGGAIPILSTLRNFLKVNQVEKFHGILNGTTNYILTKMLERGESYERILAEAQSLGYAEADPTADVEGYDAMHKLAILTHLCFGISPDLDRIARKGIIDISVEEMKLASKMGYAIKLIASAKLEKGKLQLKVAPTLLSNSHPLASVHDVLNAISIQSDLAGELTFSGRGAGELPTASAILEDLYFLLRNTPTKASTGYTNENIRIDYSTETYDYFLYLHVPELQAAEQLATFVHLLKKEGIHVHETTQTIEQGGFVSIGAIVSSPNDNCLKIINHYMQNQLSIREVLIEKEDNAFAASINL